MDVEPGERVTVRVSSRRPVRAKLVDHPTPGYDVVSADLDTALSRDDAGLTIASSRYGELATTRRLGKLAQRRDTEGGMTVAFGAPERGLPSILDVDPGSVGRDQTDDESTGFDLWLNTVPNQGSEVVRTEEALFASLACLTLTE
jgi:predicted SPOUT superfamily RNA methylase MTH1